MAVSFTNDTGSVLTDLTIDFNYEQWRYVNTSGWDLSGTGGLAGTAVNGFDFAGAPSGSGSNGIPTSTPIHISLTGLSITPGASFGLSWITTDITGSDNGVAVDDFRIAPSVPTVPENAPPSVCLLLAAGLLLGGERLFRRRTA